MFSADLLQMMLACGVPSWVQDFLLSAEILTA